MKQKSLFALVFLLFNLPLFGQGSTPAATPVAQNIFGQPLPGTKVAICSTNPGTSAAPCSSLVSTFTDITIGTACSGVAGTQPLNNQSSPSVGSGCSNPGLADSRGNVIAFANAGNYWCQYYGPQIVSFVQPCIFPSVAGGSLPNPASFPGPVTINGPLTLSGSPSSFILTDPGTFTNTQMNLFVQSLVNGCNPSTEFTLQQGANFDTEGVTGCLHVPNTSTVHQASGVAGYVVNDSTTTFGVGVYGSARVGATGAVAEAMNTVAADQVGIPGTVIGLEIDTNIGRVDSTVAALDLFGAWTAQPTGSANAINIAQPGSGSIHYQDGIVFLPGATNNTCAGGGNCGALFLFQSGTGAGQDSQQILFNSTSHSGLFKLRDSSGDFFMNSALSVAGTLTTSSGGIFIPGSGSGTSTLLAAATGGGVATLPAGAGTLCYLSVCGGGSGGVFPGPRPWIDVTAAPYSADPTGAVDATAAINSAIAACGGGTVFLPVGTYKQAGPITQSVPCTVMGWNRTAIIKKSYSSTHGVPGAHGSWIISANNSTISGIEYDGNDASFSGDCFADAANGTHDIVLDRLYVHNCDQFSIVFTAAATGNVGPSRITIQNSTIVGGVNGNPILLNQGLDSIFIINNPLIDGSNCTGACSGIGTINAEAQGLTNAITNLHIENNGIIRCTLSWCVQAGPFNSYMMTGLIISGNYFALSQNSSNGILSFPANFGASVTGNTFDYNGFTATLGVIENATSTGTTVTGNICYCENAGVGAFFWGDGGMNVNVSGNTISGGGETGGAAIALTVGYAPNSITNIAEVGNVVTVTVSGALSVKFQPGGAVAICDAGGNCAPSSGSYLGNYMMINTNYNRIAGTFSYISPYTGLACAGACGTVKGTVSNNLVSNNVIHLPLASIACTPLCPVTGLQIRAQTTDIQVLSNNVFRGNHISGSTMDPTSTPGVGKPGTCISIQGSAFAHIMDSNIFQANDCESSLNGINRTIGSNTQFLDNILTNITNPWTGTPQTGEIISFKTPLVMQVTGADFTCGTGGTIDPCTTFSTIAGLSLALPQVLVNWSFACDIVTSQATAAVADQIGVQTATNGAVNLTAMATAYPSSSTLTAGSITDVAVTTTTQSVLTFTPGGVGTKIPIHLAGTIEGANVNGTTLNIRTLTGAAADLLTFYRGGFCTLRSGNGN